jgi:mannose-1-phosphate guanylyltransferase/mannose-6-phosphate isomerase
MYAVILAGGGGTRLWPLSRQARPKPFLNLLGDRTLLQATVDRLSPLIEPNDVFVVADGRYAPFVREQLPELPEPNLVLEPVGRNTAAAVALAAVTIDRLGDDVMCVLPADHLVTDEAAFRGALEAAGARAARGDMVTLGIAPTGPETGFGYVLATGDPEPIDGLAAYRVERFVEKPSIERAAELIESGRASWNAGIFIWRRDVVLDGLQRHAPDIVGPMTGEGLAGHYPTLRATSIDYALLEPASQEGLVAVIPVEAGWSDVGTWAALLDAMGGGVASSVGAGSDLLAIDTGDVMVHATGGRLVALVGLSDTIVVDTPDAILVCARDRAQDVKRVVDELAASGRRDRL